MGLKAKQDYMPQLRRAMWDGLMRECRRRGLLPGEIMQELAKDDIVKLLELMLKAAPREAHVSGKVQHSHTHEGTINMDATNNFLTQFEEEASEDSGQELH